MHILVVAAHPDDEAIGCGGVILQNAEYGSQVEVVLLTSGELGCPGEDLEQTKTMRVHEAFEASAILGSKVVDFWGEPDGALAINADTISHMTRLLAERKPDIIYVTGEDDAHSDHKAAATIVRKAVEQSIFSPKCFMYEVWTPMSTYDVVIDITAEIGKKLQAIRKHESQVKRIRFDEAALALARFRGELHNRPHGPYAEVYKQMEVLK